MSSNSTRTASVDFISSWSDLTAGRLFKHCFTVTGKNRYFWQQNMKFLHVTAFQRVPQSLASERPSASIPVRPPVHAPQVVSYNQTKKGPPCMGKPVHLGYQE